MPHLRETAVSQIGNQGLMKLMDSCCQVSSFSKKCQSFVVLHETS